MRSELKTLARQCLMVSVLLAVCVFAATWVLRPVLVRSGSATAELGLTRAGDLEAAGETEIALAAYRDALARGLRGEADISHAEKRAGVLLLALNRPEEALAHLQRAQASPEPALNGYGPLVGALSALGRAEEAEGVARTWLAASGDDPRNRADALGALGSLALHAGRGSEAESHYREALTLEPSHECRVGLARALYSRGAAVEARAVLVDYLTAAPPGPAANRAWAMLKVEE